jgi:hypothetical protein
MSRRFSSLVVLTLTVWVLFSLWHALPTQMQGTATVSGVVVKLDGQPAVGATVRRQTAAENTQSAADGGFTLGGLAEGQCITVTAWLEGYYVGWEVVTPTVSGITITLRPYPKGDNEDYVWRSALDPEEDPRFMCSHCMVAFPEWEAGAHGQSAKNPRFFSMYNGTDVSATVQVGAGYVQDFPGTAGNCATCHAPAAASGRQRAFTADMNELQPGAEEEGVGCDFCHHIGGVYLNPATGLPYPNVPGVLSYRLYRTYDPDVLFLGPLDDVTRRVSFLPLEKKSQFCAPCHQFSFWGTPIYQSFSEWLESPYPAQGIECQTCHMPPETVPYFVNPDVPGGLTRDPSTLASHLDLGVKDPEFIQKTVAMTVTAQISGTSVSVDVAITNVFAGHDVPTDYPGRNMILVVKARDGEGHELAQIRGPEVPDWGGVGSQPGDYAGQPGKGYAKILRDRETGEWPVVSYWKQAFIQSDNRIPAGATDESHYEFELLPVAKRAGSSRPRADEGLAPEAPVRVEATLLFRRLFIAQAREKGWNESDIVMAQQEVVASSE